MEKIFEDRQAFNFYRSYYEVSLLLDDINRAEFINSILHYQFTGELLEPKNRDAAIMFKGQMHSLKKQVNGYAKGKETYPNGNPTKGKDKGSHKEVQEKEEVKEKEKEEVEQTIPTKSDIDFDALVKGINDKTKRKFHSINKSPQNKYLARLKEGYTKKHISIAIKNAVKEEYHIKTNYKYLTPEFFSRSTTLDKYADVTQIKEPVKEQNYAKGPWN